MTLGSTEPLKKMSTKNIYWGTVCRWIGLTTLPPSYAIYIEIWEPLNVLEPSGPA